MYEVASSQRTTQKEKGRREMDIDHLVSNSVRAEGRERGPESPLGGGQAKAETKRSSQLLKKSL